MFGSKTLDRIEQMLDSAMSGDCMESDYDETRLSRLETQWKRFLGQSQLSHQNLEKEKENVKRLISDISHQTKTPLANMKLYVSLLLENMERRELKYSNCGQETEQGIQMQDGTTGQDNSSQEEQNLSLLREIQKQTDRLDFLIQSLTKMSRLESNLVEVKPVMQPVFFLADEAVRNIQPKADEKKIEIIFSCPHECSACFDFKWTEEALENILDNAVKYSDFGGKMVVSVIEYEMYAAISVKDFGIGIGEEDIPKIFERFYRASEVQQEEGVGIGLYLARDILRKENGHIRVKSKKGEGAEFILYLWRELSSLASG